MVAPPRPRCTFCSGLGPLTEEHILSQRATKLFERQGILTGDACHFVELDPNQPPKQHEVQAQIRSAFADRRRRKSSKRLYARNVCGPCNNGWMRRLDEEAFWFVEAAAKTFRGEYHLPLTAANATPLARWALMKTLCTFARDGDLVLPHHTEAVRNGRMPDDVRVEVVQSRIHGFHAFALRTAFAPHGAWIAVFRFCDYYLRLFFDPADSPHRLVRCLHRGRMIHPMDESSVRYVESDPLGNVTTPRNVPEELELLCYMLCAECGPASPP